MTISITTLDTDMLRKMNIPSVYIKTLISSHHAYD